MNTAATTKAFGRLALLCGRHACRSRLRASLCQPVFSHKRSHLLAGVLSRSWSRKQHKNENKNKRFHHRIKNSHVIFLAACAGAPDYAPEFVTIDLRAGHASTWP